MPLPLVSRSRFDDLAKRCSDLEAERRMLMDRVLELSQQKPLYAPTTRDNLAGGVLPLAMKDDKPEEPVSPKGRFTISDVRSMADSAARKAASGLGPSLWSSTKPKVVNGN